MRYFIIQKFLYIFVSLQVDVKEDNITNSAEDVLNIIAYALDTTKDDSSRFYENKQIQTDINALKTTGTQYDNCLIQVPTTIPEKHLIKDEIRTELIEPIKLFHPSDKSQFYRHDNTNNTLLMHPKLSVTPHKPDDVHNKLYQHIIIDLPQNNENNSMEMSTIGHSEQNKNFIASDVKKCDKLLSHFREFMIINCAKLHMLLENWKINFIKRI